MRPKPDADGVIRYKLTLHQATTRTDSVRQEKMADIALRKSLATQKQIDYAMILLRKNGFATRETDEDFEQFDLPVEPGISVEAWLSNLTVRQIGHLIDELKSWQQELDLG